MTEPQLVLTGSTSNFREMWVNIFMWTVLSTALVHVLAGTVAFFSFRKVPFAWAIPLVYLAFGILIASALSSITGIMIAAVYTSGGFDMPATQIYIAGFGQTLLICLLAFTRFYVLL